MAFGIFISYRRDDTQGDAGRLFDVISAALPEAEIFIDIDSLRPGERYQEVIDRTVSDASVALVLIGPRWLSDRLQDPEDLHRLEIKEALERGLHVIPVLVHRAAMPTAAQLPADIRALQGCNAHELADRRWRSDANELVEYLQTLARSPAPPDAGAEPGLPSRAPTGTPSLAEVFALSEPVARAVAVGAGAIWFLTSTGLHRLDVDGSGEVEAVETGSPGESADRRACYALAVSEESVWVTHTYGTVERVDPATRSVAAQIDIGTTGMPKLALGNGAVWAAGSAPGTIFRIDPATNSLTHGFLLDNSPVSDDITSGDGVVWILSSRYDRRVQRGSLFYLHRLDADSFADKPRLNTFKIRGELPTSSNVVDACGAVWISHVANNVPLVSRVSPVSGRVTATISFEAFDVPSQELDRSKSSTVLLAGTGGGLWAATHRHLCRIDPLANAVTTQVELEGEISAITTDDDSVWVATRNPDLLQRVTPG